MIQAEKALHCRGCGDQGWGWAGIVNTCID